MTTTKKQGRPKAINLGWVAKQKEYLSLTAKTLGDGSPNPAYRRLTREIKQAEKERARWDEFVAWVAANKGFSKTNQYPIRAAAGSIPVGDAFLRKNADGTSNYLLVDTAWNQYLAAQDAE